MSALERWLGRSLANRFTFNALLLTAQAILLLGLIAAGLSYHFARQRLQLELEQAAEVVAQRLQTEIDQAVTDVWALAENPLIGNALLDSEERKTYLTPFLRGYLRSFQPDWLCLHDFTGHALGCESERELAKLDFRGAPWLPPLLEEGRSYVELITAASRWRLFFAHPVANPTAGSYDGFLTTSVDLAALAREAVRLAPRELAFRLTAGGGEHIELTDEEEKRWQDMLVVSRPLIVAEPVSRLNLMLGVGQARSVLYALLAQLAIGYLLLSLIVVALTFVAARRLSRRLTRRLAAVSQTAEEIAASGQLAEMTDDGSEDEIGTLRRAFIRMIDRLRDAQLHLEERVKERTRYLELTMEALREARDHAEQASRAKSQFLASMSHELRTPLNAVLGFAQLLESDPELNELQREQVRDIEVAGRHLLTLINEILDLARIESGRLQVSVESVELAPLIRECWTQVEALATKRGITATFDTEACGLFPMRGDRTRIRQILLNLLSNAVKYNRDGGQVSVRCTLEGEHLRVAVTDTGVGLRPEQIDSLFQPFNRLGREASGIEGTGIGLVIAKHLTELMGGEIGVESTVGEGSTFWFALPTAEPASEQAPPPAAPPSQPAQGASRRLLYIEDSPANQRLLSALFAKQKDVELLLAADPREGLDLAASRMPDVILLDMHLPGMNGREVLSRLREDERTRAIPVIVVSANAMQEEIEATLAAGAAAYLTKPIELAALLRTLEQVLGEGACGHDVPPAVSPQS